MKIRPPELKCQPDIAKAKRHLWKLPEILIEVLRWPLFGVIIASMFVMCPIMYVYEKAGDLSFWFNQKRMNVSPNKYKD